MKVTQDNTAKTNQVLCGHYDGELWGVAVSPNSTQFATCVILFNLIPGWRRVRQNLRRQTAHPALRGEQNRRRGNERNHPAESDRLVRRLHRRRRREGEGLLAQRGRPQADKLDLIQRLPTAVKAEKNPAVDQRPQILATGNPHFLTPRATSLPSACTARPPRSR